jgi:hypothetical protein
MASRVREADRQIQEARRVRAEGNLRAEELLRSCLTEVQQSQLQRHGWFEVTAASGRAYRVYRGYAGNVISEGQRFCIHGSPDLPDADQMLGQKLLIETDEATFLRIANASGQRARLAA